MGLRRYEKYKESGVPWIGEIPEHWEVRRFKFYYEASMGQTILKSDLKTDGKIPVFSATESDTVFGYIDHPTVILKKGDLVIPARGNSIGHILLVLDTATCTQTTIYAKKKVKEIDDKYIFYFHKGFRLQLYQFDRTAIPQLTVEQVKENPFLVPPLHEQTAIAEYLDRKTAEIDALIEKKERLLDLYEEEKTAIINRAVTKGIDPNVKMKDAGIPWIGEIPKHWEVKKLKYFASISLGKMLTTKNRGNLLLKPYLRAANLEWLHVNVSDVKEMWFSKDELKKLRLKKNDLLVSEGGEAGRTAIWLEELPECYIQNSVHKISITSGESHFFLWLFFVYGQKGAFEWLVNRISIAHLTGEKLKEIEFPIPPTEEQTSIVNYIKEETAQIDKKIEKTKQSIELLKEYRTTLISEVVTGKIKVN